MASTPRTVSVDVEIGLSKFIAGMEQIKAQLDELARGYARAIRQPPKPWQPRSWYATSERAS